ncbi:nucleotide exchange factor GrpE [Candidatus Methylomirabilis sp.]|uniref:nucleotide exchange factor GrpE n=1 Tax=Candidatus Methylomirabilis sp. TaxID=2032687 RepID=UPI002A628BBC|nr:nucleotide exchange factor GrpE [Candidatus Methylomirabilis sp.]
MDQESEEAKTLTSDNAQEGSVAPATELESTISTLQAGLKEKTAEIESLNDRLLRLQAEFENYKKRAARERGEFVRFANEGLLLELLPVVDSLEHAVVTTRSGIDAQGVAEGLDVIRRLFQATLEKAGVKSIEALGHEFDPNFHQAVAQVESTDGRDNIAIEEVRKGYLLEGRLLRPAMVKVSKTRVSSSEFRVSSADEDEPETRNV